MAGVELFRERTRNFGADGTPHYATSILAMIKYSQVVIVVDEFDRVRDAGVRAKLASLLKLISDSRLPVRFVLVGDRATFQNVVDEHPSLIRHITPVWTNPLSVEAIHDLLDSCADRCGLRFSDESKRLIGEVACGSPYHARFFGMHGALIAIARDSDEIGRVELNDGFARAFEEWASLNRDDAATFRSLTDSGQASSDRLIELARSFARADTAADVDTVGASYGPADRGGGDGVTALEPALTRSDSGVEFRDATAPQFLIALQHLGATNDLGKRVKGRARA